MKLYIANGTCSRAAQVIANELDLQPELVHFDTAGRTTSSGESFADVNPLGYVPVLQLDTPEKDRLTETAIVCNYLADLSPESKLTPRLGTLERTKVDMMLNYIGTEIAQKHIPLMRKLLSEQGTEWNRSKLVAAYSRLDDMLSDGRAYLTGSDFSVIDAYVWGSMWHERSGASIQHLSNLFAWKARVEDRPSVQKALRDEAELVAKHKAQIAAAQEA
jgi:glutathione S-transferase